MKPILEIQGVGKKFHIRHLPGGYLSLRERIADFFSFQKSTSEEFWALRDVSFHVQPGDSVGIIGRNGAGKSTLLKILSKITPPTTGHIVSRGRIASLLEVGTGFHPELTGRENIFFNGSLLGMKRREIENKFDEIVDFSGVEKFLDTPLKHFSSGMQLRLAFAVAAFLEPEILIIDEVLAVGDAEFQKKCIGKMEDVSRSGRTILFVSHNLAAVENLCRYGVLLDRGEVQFAGPVAGTIQKFQASFQAQGGMTWQNPAPNKTAASIKAVRVELLGQQPALKLLIHTRVASAEPHKKLFIAFDIHTSIGITVAQAIPSLEPFIDRKADQQLSFEIDLPALIPDQYKVSVWLGSHNTETMCWEKEVVAFEVVDSPMEGRSFPHSHNNGFVVAPSRWLQHEAAC
jgi:lipopolysaccharide transport system ATP-binding protein